MKPALGRWCVLCLILAGLLAGCTAIPPLAPVDVQAPGWQVQEVPAIWRPGGQAPELIGELLFAVNPADGARLVQFSKQGLPLVTAQLATNGWEISSPLNPGRHRGRPPAPARVLWFQLDAFPPVWTPTSPWRLALKPSDGGWSFLNDRTGESLEVAGPPP